MLLGKNRRKSRKNARRVVVRDKDGRHVAGHTDMSTVNATDANTASANRLSHDGHVCGVGAIHVHFNGIGMKRLIVALLDNVKGQAVLFCKGKGIAYSFVIGSAAEHTGNEGLIGAMSAVCVRKRVVEPELYANERVGRKRTGCEGNAKSACGMR